MKTHSLLMWIVAALLIVSCMPVQPAPSAELPVQTKPATVEAMATPAIEAAPASTATIPVEALMNATYSGIYDEPVTLTDGLYEGEPFIEGDASRPVVQYIDETELYGDLDGDGVDDAVVFLLESSGGSGAFTYVAAQLNAGGQPVDAGAVMVEDRIGVRSAVIEDGAVVLDIIMAGPGDGACCGSHKARKTYALQDGRLVETTPEGSELVKVTADDLIGTSWTLTELNYDQPALAHVEATISFQDGQFNGFGGCNNYTASYNLSDDNPFVMATGPVLVTQMSCPDPIANQEAAYFAALDTVSQWGYDYGKLALYYMDAQGEPGRLLFAPQPVTNAADITVPPPTEELIMLRANPWQWVSFTDPMETFDVENPASYQVTFNTDASMAIVADCNNAAGFYQGEGGELSTEIGPMTMAACPPASRSDQFIKYLSSAVRYFFKDGQLYTDLMADGGTMVFAPASAEIVDESEYMPASSISKNGFAADVQALRALEGQEVKVWGFVDHGNMYGDAGAQKVLGDWWSGDGPDPNTWRFNLKGNANDEVGQSFEVRVPNDAGRDDLLKAFAADALAGKPTRVFVTGKIFTFDAPTNASTLIGMYMEAPSSDAIALDAPAATQASRSLPEDVVKNLDDFLKSQVYSEGADPRTHAPGLILLVETPDGRYLNAEGVASMEDGTPMQVGDRLEIGSNSKSFTDVLLLQLQEEGLLSLNDSLATWLPEWAAKIPNGDQMTLRQLAQHTSGVWDYGDSIIGEAANDPAKLEQGYTPQQLVQYAIDNGTPDFLPGETGQWKYSNTGYILLGMVLEKATGQSLGDLYKEHIFDPLGLKTARLIERVPQPGEITDGYWWTDEGQINNTTNWNVSQGWAAGGIAMTAEDLLTYAKGLSAGKLFQNPDTLAEMLTFDPNGMDKMMPYGLGLLDFSLVGVPGSWGHEGQTAGFQSLWYTNPETGVTVVGLTNSAAFSAYSFLGVASILANEAGGATN